MITIYIIVNIIILTLMYYYIAFLKNDLIFYKLELDKWPFCIFFSFWKFIIQETMKYRTLYWWDLKSY